MIRILAWAGIFYLVVILPGPKWWSLFGFILVFVLLRCAYKWWKAAREERRLRDSGRVL